MQPQIFYPNIKLAGFVKCYWTLESEKENTPVKNTIVPDGTMKLIFHYGDTYKHYPQHKKAVILPKCFLIGQLTKPYIVEPLGITGSFVVRFQPNGFLPFSTIPIKQLENTAVPINQLFGDEGKTIGENILKAKSTDERIELIENFLLNKLANQQTIDDVVQSIVETIIATNGRVSINNFSKQHSINRRQLTRKFSSIIGLSPKQLSKTIRIQSTLKSLLNKDITNLTDLAYENDFFDQAHFIKDFKEFTGLTPKEFYGDDLKMSLIFERTKD